MNAIDVLRDSDVLQASSACHYVRPPELASVFPDWVFPSGCVDKPSGLLRLTLNSVKELGLAQPFDFDVELHGTVENAGTPSMAAIVRWDVDQPVGQDFVAASGLAVHVVRVEGLVRTGVVLRLQPLQGVDCSGAARAFPGWMAWFAEPANLTFHTIVDGVANTVTLQWYVFQAQIGSPPVPRRIPIEAVVVQILFGGRLDTEGVILGPGGVPEPIPPGPLPFREALGDALVSLAGTKLALTVRDPGTRRQLQEAGLRAAQVSVDRMLRAVGGA